MKLTERLLAAVHAMTVPAAVPQAAQEVRTAASQVMWNQMFTTGMDRLAWTGALVMPFAQHPTVHAAVEAISSSISALPIEMFPESDKKKERPIKDSIVLDLLENPGNDQDGPQFLEGTIDFMKLEGEAFWFLDGFARRTGSGPKFPTRMELWEPHNVRAVMNDGNVVGWEYQSGGDIFRTTADRVIQFKHFNPYDAIRGLAPLDAAMIAITGGYKALQHQDSFFTNAAIPAGLLMPRENAIVQAEAMIRLRDEMEARHMGPTKVGRIGAIAAPVDFKEIGMSQKDMDFQAWIDTASDFILMVFKVPPSVAGLQKDANYNESVHQSKRFWYNHLPLVKYLERRILQRLCKPFGIPEVPYFKTEMIKALTEDQESLSNQARNYWNMGVPFADINERLELGFDATGPGAETGFVAFSLVPADEQAKAGTNDAIGGPERGPRQGEEQNQPGDESTVADDPTQGKRRAFTVSPDTPEGRETFRTMNWRTLISRVRDEEMLYQKRLRYHFHQMKMEVLARLAGKKAVKANIDIQAVMFDPDKAADDLERKVEPLYKSSLRKGAEAIAEELRLEGSFDFLSPEVQKFLNEKMFEIADLVDQPVADRLRATLLDGVQKGESIDKLADRVEEVFGVEQSRARRIARTEVAEAFNGGRFATMKETGVTQIEWLTARDSRVRETHEDLDGEKVSIGEKFSNGLLYPLDPSGPPQEIVNCRCVALPVA